VKLDKNKVIAIARHYVYAALSAGLAAYLSGTTDAKAVATAAVVGVLGPILGALDPKNTKYGVGSKKA
jgi:hypothetical protein